MFFLKNTLPKDVEQTDKLFERQYASAIVLTHAAVRNPCDGSATSPSAREQHSLCSVTITLVRQKLDRYGW